MPVEFRGSLPADALPQRAAETLPDLNGHIRADATNLPDLSGHINGKYHEEIPQTPEVKNFDAGDYNVPYVEKLIPGAPKIFILPGWCGVTDANDPALDEYNRLGYSVIQVGTPSAKEKGSLKKFFPPTLPLAEDAKTFTKFINAKTEEEEMVSIVGCSYGGLSALWVVDHIPDKVDHLMVIDPAIRHPIDNVFFLAGRYTGNMARETYAEVLEKKTKDGFIGVARTAGEAAANPIDSIRRGFGIIHDETAIQKAYDAAKKGVKITVVTSKGDGIFHYDKTEKKFKQGFARAFEADTGNGTIYFPYSLKQLMPRFANTEGTHGSGKTGEEFARFTIDEWKETEKHFADLAA